MHMCIYLGEIFSISECGFKAFHFRHVVVYPKQQALTSRSKNYGMTWATRLMSGCTRFVVGYLINSHLAFAFLRFTF